MSRWLLALHGPDPKPPGPGIPEALTCTKGEVEWGDERSVGAEAVGE
jgi:hypothetical protein